MLWSGDGGELKDRPVNQTIEGFNPPSGVWTAQPTKDLQP